MLRITSSITMPLRISPGITALIIAMAAVTNVVFMYYYIHAWIPPVSLIIQFTRAIVLAWIIMWIYAGILQISKIVGYIWISSVLILLTINCAIDLFCYNIYHIHFTHDFLIAMMDATQVEASDFLSVYMDGRFWTYFGILAFFLSAVYLSFKALTPVIHRSINSYPVFWSSAVTLTLLLSMWCNVSARNVMGANTDVTAKIISAFSYRPAQKITAVMPAMTIADHSDAPEELVIIVGESHSKDHSQIYGYTYPTQPKLADMAADSAIIVFSDAKTSSSYTIGTFKEIIGTWSHTLPEDSVWYRCPTFFHVAKAAGFHTAWISNQTRIGSGDTPIGIMSEIADTSLWTNIGLKPQKIYDEALLKLLDARLSDGNSPRLTLIHLNGSHMMFNDRYPENRNHFSVSDYPDLRQWQRQTVADYDNSVRYNDSVLTEIFRSCSAHDALVIYFSDHGEDLYQSSEGFYGHGQARNTPSFAITERIPFIVYCSDTFKNRHPSLYYRIKHSANTPVNTTNLTYTVMDILGVELDGHPAARSRSFFK